MSEVIVDTLKHSGNSGTANVTLASSGAVTTADDLTVGDNLVATKQNGCQRIVLEQFLCPCDGSAIVLQDGSKTIANVSSDQVLSTWADVNGSTIAYTPPTGTTQVIYEFHCPWGYADSNFPIIGFKFFIDSDEVVYARRSVSAEDGDNVFVFKWGINIGGSANTNTGRLASWTSAKTLKMQAEEYSTSYEGKLFQSNHHGSSGTDTFMQPLLGITAIG